VYFNATQRKQYCAFVTILNILRVFDIIKDENLIVAV